MVNSAECPNCERMIDLGQTQCRCGRKLAEEKPLNVDTVIREIMIPDRWAEDREKIARERPELAMIPNTPDEASKLIANLTKELKTNNTANEEKENQRLARRQRYLDSIYGTAPPAMGAKETE